MKTYCPNCGRGFDLSTENIELWQRTNCKSCKALLEVSDTIASPAKVRVIKVPVDDDEGDD